MKMENDQTKWEWLAKYHAGDLSDDERKEAEQWLAKSKEDQELLITTQKLWGKTSLEADYYLPDTDHGWASFQLKVGMREKHSKAYIYTGIAAAVTLLLVFVFLLPSKDQTEMILVAAGAEVRNITLPDGSQVWLNENATLSYPETFNVSNREVHLKGEAFFEVEKAEGKRFTVYTQSTKTEVIGTSFNLKALPDQPVEIHVSTGKVAFSVRAENEAVFLKPGEAAIYSGASNNEIFTKPIEDVNYRSWQNKQLVFQNTSLRQLAKTLEEYFDVTVHVPDELQHCRFTASFKNPEILQILDVLSITGNLNIHETKNGYALSGDGCN